MLLSKMNGGSRMQYLKQEVKQRIVLSALAEFKEKGYTAASIRNIASNANIALGTVYKYFKNKEDLFNTIIEPVYQDFSYEINKIMIAELNSFDTLIDIKDKVLEIFERNTLELLILFGKSKGSKYEHFKNELVETLQKVLEKEVFYRFEDKEIIQDPFIIRVFAITLVEGVYTILKTQEDGVRIRALIDQFIYLLFIDIDKRFKEMIHIL